MKTLDAHQPCPCGRLAAGKGGKPLTYGSCCGRWLEPQTASAFPPDAESLMRSRYSAFVLEREAYLLQSWAAQHRPANIDFDAGVKWLGLEVRAHRQTGADTAEVEFVARQKPMGGPAVRLHERSRFVRRDGRWLYVDGDAL
ncbi:YchJ family metal-binding protein [Rhodoferax sp. GW822-FHT02A01]|uniref:YchJ family protein n=1 Tax=Rhodoferax sp. GW822-FHT02A01 TaxID=3141537 RepID=UPI00315C8D8B